MDIDNQWCNYYKILHIWKRYKTRIPNLCLFILVLEISFLYIKENKNIKDINIFDNIFLYSIYADDTTFFVIDEDSVIEVMDASNKFSLVSDLKASEANCEIAGIVSWRGITGTLWYGLYWLNQKQ